MTHYMRAQPDLPWSYITPDLYEHLLAIAVNDPASCEGAAFARVESFKNGDDGISPQEIPT